jgi:DNA mismatch repair protein MutS
MAGKSTYLRQNALIVLMAHIGSFVSAEEASIGLVDQLFCRVGASDNLTQGESTFLVEMIETAHILRQATTHSLVIMDEVGRGTGSDDGLALAQAILENLADDIKALTLFATHYHELTRLSNNRITNYSLRVKEDGGQIYFLRQLIKSAATGSYGIYVAQLAGVPPAVTNKAQEYLKLLLNSKGFTPLLPQKVQIGRNSKESKESNNQQLLFSNEDRLGEAIKNFDINKASPLEALNFIAELKKQYLL